MIKMLVFAVMNWVYLHFKTAELTREDRKVNEDIHRIDVASDDAVLSELRHRYTRD
jgi:hypothetical protein